MEKLDFLIDYLLKEDKRASEYFWGELEDRKKLYRALVNIRSPKPIAAEYLKVEKEYLESELKKQGIINSKYILALNNKYKNTRIKNTDKICLWQGDITLLDIDAIVNPANSQGLGCFLPLHNCLDNQIGTKAGVSLRLECNEIMKTKNYSLETGNAFLTSAYSLPARNIIHTVGPIIEKEVTKEQDKKLSDCYLNCLKLALENNIRTIAFPCISTGVFRFPKDLASKIAISTVDNFLSNNRDKIDKVVFCLWNNEDVEIYEKNIK